MRRSRDPVLWIAAASLVLAAVVGVTEARGWIGKTFPGFLVLENRVVASAGLSHWPAIAGGEIYQHEIVAVDGRPLRSASELGALVAALPEGAPVRYRFRSGDREFERVVETRRFETLDAVLLFGAYGLTGLAFGAIALLIRYLRGSDRLADGTFAFFWIGALYTMSALDLYGPYRMFRVHVLCEAFLFAGAIHMAAVFPQPARLVERNPRLVWLPYGLAAPLALASQVGLYAPGAYVATRLVAMLALGVAVISLIASQVRAYLRPRSFEARQRVRVVAFGALVALTPLVMLLMVSPLTGRDASHNLMAFTGFLFPLAVGYAALRHNLLDVDAIIRRSLNYALLTIAVTAVYAGAMAWFEASMKESFQSYRGLFPIAFGVVCVMVLLPMRDRVQSWVDRLFFRTAYDYRRIVEAASGRLASVADLGVIGRELWKATDEALHPESATLFVERGGESGLQAVPLGGAQAGPAPPLAPLLDARAPVDLADGGLAVPFRAEGALVAALRLGPPRSGSLYTGEDRRLLQTLGNQGAVAIRNALALEQLRELNRNLEEKVQERTSELKAALDDLRETEAQLVHGKKMASIGRFVAGIAHELNNPLNFILGNFHYLQSYTRVLRSALDAYEREAAESAPELAARLDSVRRELDVEQVFEELGPVFDGCAEGIDRATQLVRDLRTFSRPDHGAPVAVDLHQALDSTLNLLRGSMSGVEVVREYGDIPVVECLAGQVHQVFMNLLSNAADAVRADGGTVRIRTARAGDARVAVDVEDDGCGIEAEALDRIFEPFYTTKGVGKGMGLGLAISYGIVARHAGTISVQSAPSTGTRFHIELPVAFSGDPGSADDDAEA